VSVVAALPTGTDVDWAAALARALADNQPALVAQPIVSLASGEPAGFELLARFTGPPSAAPDLWFAAADRYGFAPELTARVLTAALALRETLPPNTFLTVNVEPHLVTHPAVRDALYSCGRLDKVVLELTEHVIAPDARELTAELDRVRAAGGLIAVDDAGTGYAGLGQLLAIRPDIVKLDRELVTGVDTDPIMRALVGMLGDLAGRMDAWLLAEGVETTAELQTLAALGVPLAQGWLLARPGDPWPALDVAVRDLLGTLAVVSDLGEHIAHLVRDCRSARTRDECGPGTVLVDEHHRPLAVGFRDALGEPRLGPAMVVAASSTPTEVARRALARPVWCRGTPVVCTNPRGEVIGLVDVAEIVEAAIAA
jgi:EAL domain-containing protein (putative c-di-GMP-specific phosphodiesterase class I)